jgi:hypothetical protein
VSGRGLPQDPPVLGERVGIPCRAELVQQPCRALDVGEEEGDGAGRQLGVHDPSVVGCYVPNQRARRVGANVFFSAASSSDGPTISALGDGPPRKFATTCATRPLPNSM